MVEGWTREAREKRRTMPRHAAGEMERFTYRGRIETKRAALSAGVGEGKFSGYASKFLDAPRNERVELTDGLAGPDPAWRIQRDPRGPPRQGLASCDAVDARPR